jgi:hypothetical protein
MPSFGRHAHIVKRRYRSGLVVQHVNDVVAKVFESARNGEIPHPG